MGYIKKKIGKFREAIMKIKKFMRVNLILSLIFIGSIYFISQFEKYFIYEDILKFKYYMIQKEQISSIVNVGSSHSKYGLYYELEDKRKMNLARSSQNFYYDLQLIKKYRNKIKEDALIIIPISIFSFYSHYRDEINQNYVQLLEWNEIQKMDKIKYFLTKNFSILYPTSNILKILENKKSLKKNSKVELKIIYPKNLKLVEKEKESISTVQSHLGISDKERSIKNAEEDFINLINYIESKNWKYVLITTPFSYLYNENIEKYQKGAFKERIYDNIKEVEEKLGKKFVYLDYSHDSRLENNLEYFFDDDHLNEKGAKYFTKILLEDLKKLGYNID